MRNWLLLLSFLCFCNVSLAQDKKCSVPKGTGGKYKLVSEDYASSLPREVLLKVVLAPENLTKEYLTELRKRVKAEYCDPDYIVVDIYETEEAAVRRYDSMTAAMEAQRGNYLFDRPMKTDRLEFSPESGGSNRKIVVDFNQTVLD